MKRACLLIIGLAACCIGCGENTPATPPPAAGDFNDLATDVMAAISQAPADQGPIYVMLRDGGIARADIWHEGQQPWAEALAPAIAAAFAEASSKHRSEIDGIEICLTYDYRAGDPTEERSAFTNVHRGVHGLELSAEWKKERYSPTYMLATNRDFDKLIADFGVGLARARVFEARQILLLRETDSSWSVHPMFRGNRLITMEEVTQSNADGLARSMSRWLANQVHENGRITYKYWPSSGRESDAFNSIRILMATVCLGRMAAYYDDPSYRVLQDKNLAYNFTHYYREDDGIGYFAEDGKAKLGAAALGALALLEHPPPHPYADEQARLVELTRRLHQPDGSFRTFYLPAERNDNQNFYPGEALLMWANLIERADDRALLDAFMQSFLYYRVWHLENRNPAFVPWHTQAYYQVWRKTRDPQLAAFIFEMNDWLLSMQEWDKAVYPDTRGRFYDDDRQHFGPPHASSTGVYLEGLIDAYALAQELGDAARADRYRISICRGIRSLMQLQFADDIDMYYVSKRNYVAGGLRTTVYHNEIRVDNVQHGLMALLKILALFQEDDFLRGSADRSVGSS